jgi:hypothetical protein
MKKWNSLFNQRFGPLFLLALVICGISFITRLFLLIKSWPNLEFSPLILPGIFFIGLFFDLIVSSFFAIPVALYCWLINDSFFQKKWQRVPLFLLFFILIFIIVTIAGSEIVFWNEFNVRFNFIAVDYLVYTNEVLGNIQESYNMPLIISAVVLVTLVILFLIRKLLIAHQFAFWQTYRLVFPFFVGTACGLFLRK